ncbi:MAG: glycosyltransferase [Marinilabiliaceae bacterium]|nr:glycosyltransferase [Marinilabiliaceae bacterium]
MNISIISPYDIERNGITSYAVSFQKALNSISGVKTKMVGVVDSDFVNDCCESIVVIRKNSFSDYINAVSVLNEWSDIVFIQHSHDSFGGENGNFILMLFKGVKKPIITSFHQLTQEPSIARKRQIETIGQLSTAVVAFSNQAFEVLDHIYKVPSEKIVKIDYGVSEFNHLGREELRSNLGFDSKKIIFSYGFLNREKALQTILNALPSVNIKHPDVEFVFIGQTDSYTIKKEGEAYRFELNLMLQKSGLTNRIHLINKYVEEEELQRYLIACDLFITPYIGHSHIQSSVLTQGMALGAAIVSTPFWHSNELLSDNRGEFVSETSTEMVSEKIISLLANGSKLVKMRQSASDYGKHFKWSKILPKYQKLFQRCVDEVNNDVVEKFNELLLIPGAEPNYLNKLTDTTGMIQNAISAIPFLKDGYRIEDNALALMLYVRKFKMFGDSQSFDKINLFLSFIQYMQKDDGGFSPSLSYDRQRHKGDCSEGAFGLTLWALGELMANSPNSTYVQIAKDLFFNSVHIVPLLTSVKGMANALLGIANYLKVSKGDELMINYADKIVKQLVMQFNDESDRGWEWFSSSFSQDDAIVCLSLLEAAPFSKSKNAIDIAVKGLTFIESQVFINNFFSLVGSKSKLTQVAKKEEFDQYSIDMLPMVLIYEKLFKITGNQDYLKKHKSALMWFLGDNSLRKSLYDHSDGGCFQCLTKNGPNKQEGADSSLAFWISYYSYISTFSEGLMVR